MTTATAHGRGARGLFEPSPGQVEAAVTYLAGHWPSDGRHLAFRPLVGGLLRSVKVGAASQVVEQLAERTGDEEADKRLDLIESTRAALDEKRHVTGWPKLAERLGDGGKAVVREFK